MNAVGNQTLALGLGFKWQEIAKIKIRIIQPNRISLTPLDISGNTVQFVGHGYLGVVHPLMRVLPSWPTAPVPRKLRSRYKLATLNQVSDSRAWIANFIPPATRPRPSHPALLLHLFLVQNGTHSNLHICWYYQRVHPDWKLSHPIPEPSLDCRSGSCAG